MQCHRYALDDFDGPEVIEQQRVRHGGELEARPETDFCVDAAQMGLGGINSWGAEPLKEHMIAADQAFEWSFWLRPMATEEAGPGQSSHAISAVARSLGGA
mmetsp:Transcript_26557/g.66801  ORF Transcript_26557/g.66801 Transcript_26557/m.66801 type:complete len:101 (+) Transcript_26557:2-304(+)